MDYEDNDFQSESFQLGVEENIKFSPGSHSYSLPKFDLDDSLQVHLRYDSLVESEVLLGIQSQENHWIEDFSRESSGLEFSSGATETCSISRRNNVWSEATSSESVDLLLKSLGQDEMIVGQAIIEEPDNCDGLEGLKNQMDPIMNQDGISSSKTDNVTDIVEQFPPESVDLLQKSVRQDEMIMEQAITELDKCDGLDNLKNKKIPILEQDGSSPRGTENTTHVGSILTLDDPVEQISGLDNVLVDQLPPTDSTTENGERERSMDEGVGLGLIGEENSSSGLFRIENCNVTGVKDEVLLVDRSEGNKAMDGSATTESMRAELSIVSVQDLVDAGELSKDVPQTDEDLEKDDAETVGDHQAPNTMMNCEGDGNLVQNAESMSHVPQLDSNAIYTQHITKISECEDIISSKDAEVVVPLTTEGLGKDNVETLSRINSQTCEGDLIDTEDNNTGNLSSLLGKVDSVSHITGLSSDVVFTPHTAQISECEQVISSKDNDIVDQFIGSSQEESFSTAEGKNTSVAHSADQGASSTEALSLQIIHATNRITQGFSCVESVLKDHSSENVGHQLEDGIAVSKTEDSSANVGHESEDAIAVSKMENLLVKENTLSQGQGNETSDDLIEHRSIVAMKICSSTDIIIDSQKSEDMKAEDDCLGAYDAEACSSSSFLSVSQQICHPNLTEDGPSVVHLSRLDASALGKKTESFPTDSESIGVVSDITNMASNDTLEDAHYLLLRSDIVNAENVEQKEILNSPSHIGKSIMVTQEDRVAKLSDLDTEKASQVSSELVISPGAEQDEDCDHGREPSAEVIGHSSSSLETSGMICQNEPEPDVASIDVQQQSAEQFEECPVILHAAVKENEAAEVCVDCNGEPVLMEAEGVKPIEEIAEHPFLDESTNDTGPKGLENIEASEIKNGSRIASESTEGEKSSGTPIRSSLLLYGESSCDISLEKPGDEVYKNSNSLQNPVPSVQGSLGGCEGVFHPGSLPKCDAEGRLLEAESGVLNSNESNCGSPTIISCSEASRREKEQQETNTRSLHGIDSDALEQEAANARDGATDLIDNNTFEDDRNFTFKVNSMVDLSEKDAVNGWKPFPSMEPHKVPQTVGSSDTLTSGFCETNPKIFKDIPDENPPLSGLISTSETPKSNAVDKARPMVQEAEREISKDGMSQSKEPLYGTSEHQEEHVGSDSNTAVSGNIDKVENVDVPTVCDPKKHTAAEVDKKVCSDVEILATLPENEPSDGWKPVHSAHSHECDPNENIAAEVDKRVSPDVMATISENEPCDRWKPVHSAHPDELPQTIGLSPPASSSMCQMDANVSPVSDSQRNIAAEVDKRVSPDVMSMDALSENEKSNRWKPVHNVQTQEFPQTVGISPPTTSSIRKMDAIVLHETSLECRAPTSGTKSGRRRKGNGEAKTISSSGKASEKENNKEENITKETISTKPTKVGSSNSLCAAPTSPASVAHVVQAGEVRTGGFTEGSIIKSPVLTPAQTSNLPDLNSSVSSYMSFQQPFTDYQQVQLRAQIFVYGSIIQGSAPDETCMRAAFGESDDGRSKWENLWRVSVERLQSQKSPLSSAKTPVHIHNGARATEATRQNVHRSEVLCTPGGVDSNRSPSVVFNPNMPFSSPIWTVSTASREGSLNSMPKGPIIDSSKAFLPLQPYQSPQGRHYLGNASPWLAHLPSPGTWVVTAQTAAVDASGHHPTPPISESVRVTSVRESSASNRSGKQLAPPNPFVHIASPSLPAGNSLGIDATRTTVSSAKLSSTETKPRKKRRNVTSDESGQIASIVQSQRDPASVPARSPTSVATTTISPGPPISVAATTIISSQSLTPAARTTLNFAQSPTSVVTTTVTSARSPASVAKTTTISSMNVASGTRSSGSSLVSFTHDQILSGGETELKVAYPEELCGGVEQAKQQAEDAALLAANTVRNCQSIWSQLALQRNSGVVSDLQATLESSAVSIAAAASVAKAAAAVAKVASDVALQAKLTADEALVTNKSGIHTGTFLRDDVRSLGRVTPSSILKGRDQASNSDSVLVAVREAAKKRVEAASAAAKRAENLDALLKAAEMTAEAVSQAGTIIAMGEPLPFTLAELVDAGPEGYWKMQPKSSEQLVKSSNLLTRQTHKDAIKDGRDGSVDKLDERLSNKIGTNQIAQLPKNSADDLQSSSISTSRKGYGAQKGCSEYDIRGIAEAQVVPENTPIAIRNEEHGAQLLVNTSNKTNFEEGSVVEVRPDEEGLRKAWFSAKVLSLKDGKALVSYTEHAHHKGSSQLTEWVPLDDKGGNAPRIRIPHPMTGVKLEGMKKRSRAARGDYMWAVGDKVDARLRNGWWEGVITEKSKEDETNLTVHFPAQQETSVVRAWNLRTSLIWEDGKWIEWCRPMASNSVSHGGDTPQEKPPKKSRHESEANAAVEVKERGKMTKLPGVVEVKKPEVPKPLMLSAKDKVFNAGKNTTKDTLGRKLTGLQKDGSKVNLGVPKPGKKRKFMDVSNVSKPTSVKSAKPQGTSAISSREVASDSTFKSGNSQAPSSFSSRDAASDSALKSGKPTGLPAISSREVPLDSLSMKKKPPPDVAAEPQSKVKATPLREKFVKNNEKGSGHDYFGNVMPNSVEPRRSNRRIQPTSRLLEGLQSSLIASKIPAASHDKGSKSQQRSSRGRNHG